MAHSLLFSKIKENLGFEYMVTGISSAAPILPEVVQFLADLDIRVYELLGQSEGSGPVATNSKQQWKVYYNFFCFLLFFSFSLYYYFYIIL